MSRAVRDAERAVCAKIAARQEGADVPMNPTLAEKVAAIARAKSFGRPCYVRDSRYYLPAIEYSDGTVRHLAGFTYGSGAAASAHALSHIRGRRASWVWYLLAESSTGLRERVGLPGDLPLTADERNALFAEVQRLLVA